MTQITSQPKDAQPSIIYEFGYDDIREEKFVEICIIALALGKTRPILISEP